MLQATNTDPAEVHSVAYPFFDWQKETSLFESNLENEREFLDDSGSAELNEKIAQARTRVATRTSEIPGLRDPNEVMDKGFAKSLAYRFLANEGVVSRNVAKRGSSRWGREASAFHRKWQEQLESALEEFGLSARLTRVEHHSSHAANAYYTSGLDPALIVTLDGYGSGLAGSISIGSDGAIERVHSLQYPHSLGTFYESVTSALGFRQAATKARSSASRHGRPGCPARRPLVRFDQEAGNFRIVEVNNVFFARRLAAEFPNRRGRRVPHVLELVACAYVGHYVQKTGLKNLVLSGGVAANVKLNQRLKEIPGVERIFIHPNMGDGGCGTGAALLEFAGTESAARLLKPIADVFLGPSFTSDEIADALNRSQLNFTKYTPIEPKIAALIAAGKVVARFNGRMEYGPRALGNRSILYHAKEPAVNQWLNQRLGRTEFMPFAPATLFEKRHECYQNIDGGEHAALFMTLTFDCTEGMKRDSPAGVHVDGTARPQLVSPTSNPSFHAILTEYHRLTGIPSLINTSFNMHEEPIVCSPDDAIRAFLQGNLDYLAIGEFLVAHPSARH